MYGERGSLCSRDGIVAEWEGDDWTVWGEEAKRSGGREIIIDGL